MICVITGDKSAAIQFALAYDRIWPVA
eukprot:SAG31_NODE_10931_length_1082_cov_1.093591_1_plen_26_part_10